MKKIASPIDLDTALRTLIASNTAGVSREVMAAELLNLADRVAAKYPTHITTNSSTSASNVEVVSIHPSKASADKRAKADNSKVLELTSGPFGAKDPKPGDNLATFKEHSAVYAVRPRS